LPRDGAVISIGGMAIQEKCLKEASNGRETPSNELSGRNNLKRGEGRNQEKIVRKGRHELNSSEDLSSSLSLIEFGEFDGVSVSRNIGKEDTDEFQRSTLQTEDMPPTLHHFLHLVFFILFLLFLLLFILLLLHLPLFHFSILGRLSVTCW
jgi:hypothetical protein